MTVFVGALVGSGGGLVVASLLVVVVLAVGGELIVQYSPEN